MYKDLLPIGSVVLLKEGKKRVMICSRVQTRAGSDTIYDYAACYYPEGIMAADSMFFFNHSAIERVYFIGFQDEEELAFHKAVLDKLDDFGELVIRDGQIVPKTPDV